MAYNFNNTTFSPPNDDPRGPLRAPSAPAPASPAPAPAQPAGQGAEPAAPAAPESPAVARFHSCRWHQPKDESNTEFCTHREVKPYAGTLSFDADAWCPDCQYYKLRRSPKKRESRDDYY